MSKGATIDERMKKVDAEIEAEGQKWRDAGLPGPKPMYRMNDDEFMHHVHVLALTKMMQHYFNVSDKEVELALKETFLEEMKPLFDMALSVRQDSIRNQLLNGINIVPPEGI